jgi:hypothetical protein
MERTMQNPHWLVRWIARGLIILTVSTCENYVAQAQQERARAATQATAAQTNPSAHEVADSSSSTAPYPDAPEPQNGQQASPQSGDQQSGDGKPLGTAAAPYANPTGLTGSRPAGAAIAPARQRRVHAILISLGVIAAAGIAVGTVAGMSHASPSRPN